MGLLLTYLSCCGKGQITRAVTQSRKKGPVKRHVTVLGGSGVGKSCLLLLLCGEEFRADHEITLIDNVKRDVEVDDQKVDLEIWDTPGRESLDRLRTLSYPETDVLLLCFSLDSPSSLDSVKEDWYPIVHYFLPGVPLVLVGTKADLRKPPKTTEGLVTSEAAEEVMKSMGAAFYRETSAMSGENVRELFYEAIKITLGKDYRPKTFAQWVKGNKGEEGSYVRF